MFFRRTFVTRMLFSCNSAGCNYFIYTAALCSNLFWPGRESSPNIIAILPVLLRVLLSPIECCPVYAATPLYLRIHGWCCDWVRDPPLSSAAPESTHYVLARLSQIKEPSCSRFQELTMFLFQFSISASSTPKRFRCSSDQIQTLPLD